MKSNPWILFLTKTKQLKEDLFIVNEIIFDKLLVQTSLDSFLDSYPAFAIGFCPLSKAPSLTFVDVKFQRKFGTIIQIPYKFGHAFT